MSKIAVLLPRECMLEQARRVIREEHMDIDMLKVIKTADSVYEARNVVENGAGIIVARGVQASFIKTYLNVPVAEIILTGQEMGLLIKKAKSMLRKDCPKIAIIGFKNMYSDMSYFDEIFGISLKQYFIESIEYATEAVKQALGDGADLLIGGDIVNALAAQHQIPSLFIESTEDSIRNALRMAKKMSFTAEIEKNHIAQFETVLDTSFNGIIKINEDREIIIVNKMVEELLRKTDEELKGRALCEVVPGLDTEYVDGILSGNRDTYTTSIRINGMLIMITAAPIQYEDRICGAILSCYRLTTSQNEHAAQSKKMFLQGHTTQHDFSEFNISGREMKYCVEMAKMYALSSRPVLLYGEEGTGKELLAQCIHNNSSYKGGPFVSVNCSGMTEQMQLDRLFGNPCSDDESIKKGALAIGDLGTVMIAEVEKLTLVCQYRLYRAIRYEALIQNDLERSQTLDNRIIVTAKRNLGLCVREGSFREDLYYLLNGLVIEIPSLRERPKDVEAIINRCRAEFSRRYSRFLRISEGAMKALQSYEWHGNEVQLESFCERMFLTTPKKTINEDFVQFLFDELYPNIKLRNNEEKMIVYKHPQAVKIAELLEKYNGNRAAVAKEMGISTTTLWRHMKKYGVVDRYGAE